MAETGATRESVFSSWRDLAIRHEGRIALVLLFLITIPMLTKIFTSDYGTHLAKGRQVVQTRSIPRTEFLNYPTLGNWTDNAEWGFQALLYSVRQAGGEVGVSVFVWAVVFATYLFLHRAMVLRGANPLVGVLAIFAFSGFLRIRIQPRPEILTYLYIAATIYLLSEHYFGSRKRLIYLFPPLIVAWANSHPTYLMGFLLFAVFFVDAVARDAWGRRLQWEQFRKWAIPPVAAGVVALVLCGLNPYGYDLVLAPLHLLSKGKTAGGENPVLLSISELTPVYQTGMYVYYKAAVIIVGISLFLGALGRRVYLLDLFLFGITFKGAWDVARAVSMMGLFLSPGIALHVTGFFQKLWEWFPAVRAAPPSPPPPRRDKKGRKRKGGPRTEPPPKAAGKGRRPIVILIGAGVATALTVFGTFNLGFSFSQLEYGIGITQHKFSFRAAEFLRRNPVPGKMFNFFDIGGFLDWQLYPGALTFIDGRTNSGDLFRDHQIVTSAMSGWERIIERYGITYAVMKAIDSSGMLLPVIPVMANRSGWRLVFADGLFLVFVRDLPETRRYLAKHEISKSILPQHIAWEAYHYLYLGVSPIVVYQMMANMYEMMGNRAAAIDSLENALRYGEIPAMRSRLERLRQSMGRQSQQGTR